MSLVLLRYQTFNIVSVTSGGDQIPYGLTRCSISALLSWFLCHIFSHLLLELRPLECHNA